MPITNSASTTFTVQFAPADFGAKAAVLHIASSDPAALPVDLTLLGLGAAPAELAVEQPTGSDLPNGGTTDFGPVILQGTARLTWTIKNLGDLDLTGVGVTIDGPDAARFTIITNPAAAVAGPTGSTIVTVQFTPTNLSPVVAFIHLTSSDADENPFAINLTGSGKSPVLGNADVRFAPNANNVVSSLAVQPDGQILVGGTFTNLAGQPRNRLARLNPDGTLDAFNPDANSEVLSLAVQPDGSILAGGSFTNLAGQSRNRLARLNPDGSLNASFNPNANNWVHCLALQADGRILVGGYFTTLAGQTRNRIARLHPDGSLDLAFNPNANGTVYCLAVQADGKILVGGSFTALGTQPRNYLARLNSDGSLDPDFNPEADATVSSLAVQADGRILAGGRFSMLGGQARTALARLNADGSLDADFNPMLNDWVNALAVQADGKILLAGLFTALGEQTRNYLARLNADGSLDLAFSPEANNIVTSLAIQADGKILAGGSFTVLGEQARSRRARLENDAAPQSLAVSGQSRIVWLRGGSAPEVQAVSFALSTDGGTNWSALGAGTRIDGGWELTGLRLPGGLVRARAQIASGINTGSSGLVEALAVAPTTPALQNPSLAPNQFLFRLPTVAGTVYQVQFTPALENNPRWETVKTVDGDGSVIEVFLLPSTPAGFYRVIVAP